MLQAEITDKSYCVKVNRKEFAEKLIGDTATNDLLMNDLGKVPGLHAQEWNGHFGPYIFFTIRACEEGEYEQSLAIALEVIAQYMKQDPEED